MPASSRWPRTTATIAASSPSATHAARRRASRSRTTASGRRGRRHATAAARRRARPTARCHSAPGRRDARASTAGRGGRRPVSGAGVISACTCVDRVRVERADRREVDATARAAACTALVRRFWSSSSSRNAYGRAVRISCASTDGSVVSTHVHAHRRRPRCARAARAARRRRAPRAACRRWSGARCTWSGISIGPTTFSWHAAACGNTAAMRSSASMRWIGGGLRRAAAEPQHEQRAVEVPAPARAWNIGASRTACSSVSSTVRLLHVARAPRRAGSCGAGRATARSRRRWRRPAARS